MITAPIYDRNDPNRRIAQLSGLPAAPSGKLQLSERQLLSIVRVEYYDEKGQTNLLILGTNCVYDLRQRVAQSADVLRVLTGDGRLELEGVGFTWWQTNNDLVISNNVRTRVRRPAVAGVTNALTGQDLRVTADQFRFNFATNRISYTGHVRVEDPRLELTCGRLIIGRGAGGSIDRLTAQEDVVIRDRLGGGTTTAGEAVYRVEAGFETVELTGEPHYREGLREATAERFLLDRTHDSLAAVGNARLVLPIGGKGAPGLLMLPGAGLTPAPAAKAETNRVIEVTAARVTMFLPETNGPVRGVLAETNVVLWDRQQQARATAQLARYGADGRLELQGQPEWTMGGRLVRGDAMIYEAVGPVFRVPGNAFVRLPVRSLMTPANLLGAGAARTNVVIPTNQMVEIHGRELSYRDTWLRMEGEVVAQALAGSERQGELHCAALGVQYGEHLQQIRAEGGVRLTQGPVPRADGGATARELTCTNLVFKFNAAGQLDRLEAAGPIDARSTDTFTGGRPPIARQLQCQALEAHFRGTSNIVESATATGGVRLRQNEREATSERAVYQGVEGRVRLEGKPVVTLPEGRITDAETISWDRATGRIRLNGAFRSQWKSLSLGTNATRLLPKP